MNNTRCKLLLAGAAAVACSMFGATRADVITNAGFENMISTTGPLPTDYGYWRGDMTNIVHGENDIIPFEGVCMLRFDHTTAHGSSPSIGSELWQIIDVSSYMPLIRSGGAIADAGAWFNRVGVPVETPVDTMFSLGVYAYAGEVGSFPGQWGHRELGSAMLAFESDGYAETWEQIALRWNLPDATDFIAIRVSASENVYNDVTGNEFAGHYVDGVGFTIIPTPASIACLLPASLLLLGRRQRRP